MGMHMDEHDSLYEVNTRRCTGSWLKPTTPKPRVYIIYIHIYILCSNIVHLFSVRLTALKIRLPNLHTPAWCARRPALVPLESDCSMVENRPSEVSVTGWIAKMQNRKASV